MRTTPTRSLAAALCVAALVLTGCGDDDDTAEKTTTTTEAEATTTEAEVSELEITDVWARQSPMATTMGAVYLNITSPVDDELTDASVPATVATDTQIHETVVSEGGDMSSTTMGEGEDDMSTTMGEGEDDMSSTTMGGGEDDMTTTTMAGGTMTMQEVESIELPAGETVELAPGGYHIMLIGLVEPLEVGDEIELTLTFAEAGEVTVTAEVREG